MSVKVIDGDLFQAAAPVICHQVNCKGKMGSGVAKGIRSRYPVAYERYWLLSKKEKKNSASLLGRIQICESKGKTVINMFAQDGYGYDGKLYTDYDAFERCLENVRKFILPGETIAMPYKIGCGLGGGDWDVVYGLIEKILGEYYTVELWRKEV